MSRTTANPPEELRRKFPELRPLKRTPWLGTVNGFGFSLFGKRDEDEGTRTYVATHCFCALFIPLIAVGAYRVGIAGSNSWFFFGKERLSLHYFHFGTRWVFNRCCRQESQCRAGACFGKR